MIIKGREAQTGKQDKQPAIVQQFDSQLADGLFMQAITLRLADFTSSTSRKAGCQ